MSKIIVHLGLTLDGVMQAPARPDEDTRGGFKYGGWSVPYVDPVFADGVREGNAQKRAFLFGRRTYEDFYSVWPKRTDGNPFTEVLNNYQKYVASTTLKEPLPWINSTLLKGDVPSAVGALKEHLDMNLIVLGSGVLIRSLIKHNLIDEYAISIHPLVLGSGSRLFSDGCPFANLKLIDTKTTKTGVIIATYRPDEKQE